MLMAELAVSPPIVQAHAICYGTFCLACYSVSAAYTPGAAVAKLAYAAGLKSAGDFPVVGSSPTSRTIILVVISL